MSGNSENILLDLNYPSFQDALFSLDVPELKKVLKALKKIKSMSWEILFKDKGLHWEEVKTSSGVYSLRLSQSYRAIVMRDEKFMRMMALHLDHDGAYGKK